MSEDQSPPYPDDTETYSTTNKVDASVGTSAQLLIDLDFVDATPPSYTPPLVPAPLIVDSLLDGNSAQELEQLNRENFELNRQLQLVLQQKAQIRSRVSVCRSNSLYPSNLQQKEKVLEFLQERDTFIQEREADKLVIRELEV